MFDSLLIANRGEIACRIIKTARKMGLRTIAVFSDADHDALHVQMADQAIRIGEAAAKDSYLRADRILEAAAQTDATAIHPGYGFLSEQTGLVQGCMDADITWVGPHLDAIQKMGSKIEARKIALQIGIPCIPGHSIIDQSDDALIKAAQELGLPVMIKASAGGGGKGMRAVFELAQLPSAIASARTEAQRAFGDGQLLVEKLIQNPRHIEVQLLGDKYGQILHLFERDCSVQRNHQKLLEEAPAANLSEKTRGQLFEAAMMLGRHINYDSAGTVEYIMDATTEEFYFLEMNTRLQVEHTVTEEITGLDLVELQLRVAAGEKLPICQEQITCNGHAIEARLTAEDASDNFLPSTGKILRWEPDTTLRNDSGVVSGSIIGSHYDSMIAKLIAYGTDRQEACQKLSAGLMRLKIAGIKNTRLFLRDAIQRDTFMQGRATTNFLELEWPEGWSEPANDAFVCGALARHLSHELTGSPWDSIGGFRLLENAGQPARATYIETGTHERVVIEGRDADLHVSNAGTTIGVQSIWLGQGTLQLNRQNIQDTIHIAFADEITHVGGPKFDEALSIIPLGDCSPAQFNDVSDAPDLIKSPMPGLITDVRVKPGDQVIVGDTLIIMESMKLLMELKASTNGSVIEVKGTVGDTVEAGCPLVHLKVETH